MANMKLAPISASTKKKLETVIETVLKEIKPTEQEMSRVTAYANDIVTRLKKVVPDDVEIMSVGSVARGTQIRGTSDIDIFLLFPRKYGEKILKKKGLEIAKSIVAKHKHESFVIKYAQHPYVKLILGDVGITADIVPAFKISNATEKLSSVDRTPLHNRFVNTRLSTRQKDEVRLLKGFMNAHGIRGADAETGGFSGYLCELFIYQFGNFIDTLRYFSDLKPPILIVPERREIYQEKSQELAKAIKQFNKRLIVIDPTDENRNVAAAVSEASLARFVLASRHLLKIPSTTVFYGPKYSDIHAERKLTRMREELGLDIYLLHFKVPEISEDIIWQQARRLRDRLKAIIKANGFKPAISFENFAHKDVIIAFFINTATISYHVAKGPSVYMRSASEKFMDSHTKSLGMLFDEDKLLSIEEAEHRTPKEVITHAVKNMQGFPSYMKKDNVRLYVNKVPESLAKLLYAAYIKETGI